MAPHVHALPVMLVVRATAVFALGSMLVGCSGASSPEIPLSESSSNEPVTSASGSSAPSTRETAGQPPASTGDAGTPAPDPDDGPDDACTAEAEPNDAPTTATAIKECFRGTLAGSNDNDYVRVIVPAKAKKMFIDHEASGGKVRYRVYREKITWPLNVETDSTSNTPPVNVVSGEPYLVRMTFPSGEIGDDTRGYELKVSFK